MILAAAEKLAGVIGNWLPFIRQITPPAFQHHLFPPSQHHRQRRIAFYDDDDDDYCYERNNYNNKEMWVICPFNDCSVSLLNDGSEIVIDAECPSCHRLFCAHSITSSIETGCPQSPKSFCGICYDFIPENDIVRGSATCNHPFCANCISNQVAKQLSQSIMEFNCPNPRCFEELKPQHLHPILPEEVIVRWESERL
ncbi:hypothetical protein TSUD_116110 [Trifolium subterraneum]|uniref:RING-type domain-containing protein n=1 Tax=Trifolium subterraneum TaxID=3900 RepID=A0A2Z6N6Q2_TRISU|nr:hypothetical protein TSUD_116110 [Trifolium subterraneum]